MPRLPCYEPDARDSRALLSVETSEPRLEGVFGLELKAVVGEGQKSCFSVDLAASAQKGEAVLLNSDIFNYHAPGDPDFAVDVKGSSTQNKGPDNVAQFCWEGEKGGCGQCFRHVELLDTSAAFMCDLFEVFLR